MSPVQPASVDTEPYIEGLIRRLIQCEEAAFQEFAHSFGPPLQRFFVRRGLPYEEAEELALDCILDISGKVHKYRALEGATFGSWVFTIARHALADRVRHSVQTIPIKKDYPSSPDADTADENDVIVAGVEEALAEIPAGDRMIIEMRDFQQLSYAEIGERLDIKEGTARVRHKRALGRLGTVLKKDLRIASWLKQRQRRIGRKHAN